MYFSFRTPLAGLLGLEDLLQVFYCQKIIFRPSKIRRPLTGLLWSLTGFCRKKAIDRYYLSRNHFTGLLGPEDLYRVPWAQKSVDRYPSFRTPFTGLLGLKGLRSHGFRRPFTGLRTKRPQVSWIQKTFYSHNPFYRSSRTKGPF